MESCKKQCKFCNLQFACSYVGKHQKVCKNNPDKVSFKCVTCGKTLVNLEGLQRHQLSHGRSQEKGTQVSPTVVEQDSQTDPVQITPVLSSTEMDELLREMRRTPEGSVQQGSEDVSPGTSGQGRPENEGMGTAEMDEFVRGLMS